MYHAQQLSKTAIKIRHYKAGFEAFCEAKMKIRGFALILTFGCLTVARGSIQAVWGFGWQLGHASPATTANIVSSPTYTEGCKKAKINKATLYKWLKKPVFKAELERQRDEVAAEAFGVLSQGLTKAAETLVGLLDNKDNRLKRLAAKDVIDFMIRHKENEDLDERLAVIEKRLDSQKR